MAWIPFGTFPCRKKKKIDDSSRLDVVEITHFLTCFRACFLPGWAKDLSVPQYIVWHRSGSLIKLITQEDFMAFLASYFMCCLTFLLSCKKEQTSDKFLRSVLSRELNFNFIPYYLVLDPFASFSRNSSECFWIRATGTKCWPATGTYIA